MIDSPKVRSPSFYRATIACALAAAIYSMDRDLYDSRVRAVRDRAAESGWLR